MVKRPSMTKPVHDLIGLTRYNCLRGAANLRVVRRGDVLTGNVHLWGFTFDANTRYAMASLSIWAFRVIG